MATSATIDLQFIPFHNCDGCILKVKRALRKFNGLGLIEMDPENGIFTISTIDHPETIRASLQRKFHKKSVILLPQLNPNNSSVHQSRSCVVNRQGTVDFKEMTGMLMTSSQAERIQSVECGHDVLRVHYYEKQPIISNFTPHIEDVSGFVAPPPTTKPSAPPIETMEGYAYGYPVGSYGHSTTSKNNYPDSCCTIM